MSDLYRRLDVIGDTFIVRKPQWDNIVLKTAKAYRNAIKNVEDALPSRSDGEVSLPGFASAALGAAVKGAIAPVVTNPVGAAVAAYLIIEAVKPDSKASLPPMPDFSTTPDEYEKFMNFHYNIVFSTAFQEVTEAKRKLNNGQAVSVDIDALESNLARSPMWHEPSGWDRWDTGRVEAEIERGIWARWLRTLDTEAKRENVADAMQSNDFSRTKSDGPDRHKTWQRLKAAGAFNWWYRHGGTDEQARAGDVPRGTYQMLLKIGYEQWARTFVRGDYFFMELVSHRSARFFERAMRSYEKQSFLTRARMLLHLTWGEIESLVARTRE